MPEEDLDEIWKKIPEGVDVLVTHNPPKGRGGLPSGREGEERGKRRIRIGQG
jgi:hypothetical protein